MRDERWEEVETFMEDVGDQIQYKPGIPMACRELRDHIEDKAAQYEAKGAEKKEAYHKAVEDMGDPAVLGIMLNETHQVKTPWLLVGAVLTAILLGLIRNFYQYGDLENEGYVASFLYVIGYSKYFLAGILAFAVAAKTGYPWVVKHSRLLSWGFLVIVAANIISSRFLHMPFIIWNHFFALYMFDTPVLLFSLPLMMIFAYRYRKCGYECLFMVMGMFAAVLLFAGSGTDWYFNFIYKIIFFLSGISCLCLMARKSYFSLPGRKAVAILLLMSAALAAVWGYKNESQVRQYTELMFHPEAQANSWSEDGYNGVLIKDLLGRAKPMGQVELTQEEMERYMTTEWYFGQIPEDEEDFLTRDVKYLKKGNKAIGLTNILPQHYHNNYRIAFWVLRYGWIPASLLLAGIAGMCTLFFYETARIKNRLGKMISFSCSMAITLQVVFYVCGNLGYQLGKFGTLPFISEGLASCTANMILAGMVISASRYDKVVTETDAEPENMQKRLLQWNMKTN